MDTINVRHHQRPTYKKSERYFNYEAEVVDGVVNYTKRPVVAPSLASDYSVGVNAITRQGSSSLKSRINVDVTELGETLENLK